MDGQRPGTRLRRPVQRAYQPLGCGTDDMSADEGLAPDRRLHVRMLDAGQLRFVIGWRFAVDPCGRLPGHGPDAWRGVGHPQDMETGGRLDFGVCAAVDVHYPRTGGAWAAAVLAADAAFARVLAERTAVLPRVPPYRPGEFYLRELPPLRAVLDDVSGLGLLVGRRLRRPGPRWPARPGRACARRVRHPGDRGGQVQVPHGHPCGAGRARILSAPAVRHRGRDAQRRRRGPGPSHGRPVPAARRTAPRRYPRAGRPADSHHDRPPARLTYADARNAACASILPVGQRCINIHQAGRLHAGRPRVCRSSEIAKPPRDNRAPTPLRAAAFSAAVAVGAAPKDRSVRCLSVGPSRCGHKRRGRPGRRVRRHHCAEPAFAAGFSATTSAFMPSGFPKGRPKGPTAVSAGRVLIFFSSMP